MKQYASHWRTTIFVSIILHIFAWLGFIFLLPHLLPKPKTEEVVEMAWIDVDLVEDDTTVTEELQPTETNADSGFVIPKYEFPPIIMPDFSNEPTYVEEIPPLPEPPPVPKRITLPERQPALTRTESEVIEQLEKVPEKENIVEKPKNNQGNQRMSQPPVTITESYPKLNSGLKYEGYVSIVATIGIDGKVKETKIISTSGRIIIDNIAMKAAQEWTFKPALDQDGKPMECDKIITFNFK